MCIMQLSSFLGMGGASFVAALLVAGCQEEAPKRPTLPPASAVRPSPSIPASAAAQPAPAIPSNFKRKFGPADFKFSSCVAGAETETRVATNCGSGAVVFGPYASAPKDSTVAVAFVIEGIAGSTTLLADVVSRSGSRLHTWSGRYALQEGQTVTIDFGAQMSGDAMDFETRLWSQAASKDASFKIVDAKIEIRDP
jgi:hypothetical protein